MRIARYRPAEPERWSAKRDWESLADVAVHSRLEFRSNAGAVDMLQGVAECRYRETRRGTKNSGAREEQTGRNVSRKGGRPKLCRTARLEGNGAVVCTRGSGGRVADVEVDPPGEALEVGDI